MLKSYIISTLRNRVKNKIYALINIAGWPVAYLFSSDLLKKLANHIETGIEYFSFATGITLITALISVSWQAARAAMANPVESLRYE